MTSPFLTLGKGKSRAFDENMELKDNFMLPPQPKLAKNNMRPPPLNAEFGEFEMDASAVDLEADMEKVVTISNVKMFSNITDTSKKPTFGTQLN